MNITAIVVLVITLIVGMYLGKLYKVDLHNKKLISKDSQIISLKEDVAYYKKLSELRGEQVVLIKDINLNSLTIITALKEQIEIYEDINKNN